MACFDMMKFCPHCGRQFAEKISGERSKIVCGGCGCTWTNYEDRIAELAFALAAAREEIARLRKLGCRISGDLAESELALLDGRAAIRSRDEGPVEIARLREQYQCQVNHVSKMFDELRNLAIEAGWDANEDLSSPMQFIRQYVRTGLVPQAGRLKEEVVELKSQLAALRSRNAEMD